MDESGGPLLLVIVGHNGAGKSTCYRKHLAPTLQAYFGNHIDPDAIEREIREDLAGEVYSEDEFSAMARDEATRQRQMRLANHENFSFETVFSDGVGDKLGFLHEAIAAGYTVALLAVGLDSPEKSRERVAARVEKGGHSVPDDRIFGRYPRVIDNIRQGVMVASVALLVDNSIDSHDPDGTSYYPFALFAGGVCIEADSDTPDWWSSAGGHFSPLSTTITEMLRQMYPAVGSFESVSLTVPYKKKPDLLH